MSDGLNSHEEPVLHTSDNEEWWVRGFWRKLELLESFLLPPRWFVLIHWRLRFRAANSGQLGREVAYYCWPDNILKLDYFLKYSKLWKPSINFGGRGKVFLNLESIICPFSPFWAPEIIFKVLAWLGATGRLGSVAPKNVELWGRSFLCWLPGLPGEPALSHLLLFGRASIHPDFFKEVCPVYI